MSAAPGPEVPCRTCTDFKTWSKAQSQKSPKTTTKVKRSKECPLDKDQLGRSTWSFLHTMAAYFPSTPTVDESKRMSTFLSILPDFYPCKHCADDMKIE